MALILADIDASIACIKKRMEQAGEQPPRNDRRAFQKWLDTLQNEDSLYEDPVISEVATVLLTMKRSGHTVVFLTGRSEKYRNVTQAWLKKYSLFGKLYMRDNEDWRSAADYKKDAIINIIKEYGFPDTIMAIDDDYDGDTTHVYSELGILHLKVMPRSGDLTLALKKLTP